MFKIKICLSNAFVHSESLKIIDPRSSWLHSVHSGRWLKIVELSRVNLKHLSLRYSIVTNIYNLEQNSVSQKCKWAFCAILINILFNYLPCNGETKHFYISRHGQIKIFPRDMRQKGRKGDFWKRGTINLILDTIKSLTVKTELILKSPGCDLEIKSASRATW